MSKKNTSVRLDNDTHSVLKAVAFWQGDTMGNIVKQSIKQYIKSRPELEDRVRLFLTAGYAANESTE